MDLEENLIAKFRNWQPSAPEVVAITKGSITLYWKQCEPFGFLGDSLLYRVEKNNKLPKWIVVYSGGKTTKVIDNLAPRYPHKFRLKVILKSSAVRLLGKMALNFYGDINTLYEKLGVNDTNYYILQQEGQLNNIQIKNVSINGKDTKSEMDTKHDDTKLKDISVVSIKTVVNAMNLVSGLEQKMDASGDTTNSTSGNPKWIESQWSEETWTSTDADGTSPICFCMAVKCGYLKEVQTMLDERPDLLEVPNPNNSLTPLATAVRKGDINTVRFLLTLGAEIDKPSLAGQTPLHLAVLNGDLAIAELLIEKGADKLARDWNGLRIEHFAVDSCNLSMLNYIFDKGGDLHVRDYNGWTPLFRALCQGVKTAIVEELVTRGSDLRAIDNAGLPLISVAKLLKNRHGCSRDSIICLIDTNYPHEKAVANFTRLTKKIYNVNSLLRLN